MRRATAAFAGVAVITAATEPLEAQSRDDVARFERAITAYYKRADFATAKAILDTIITRDSTLRARGDTNGAGLSNYGNPYVMRSQARRKLGDTRGAERDLDEAIALTPGLGSRDMILGYLRQADNDWKGALESFTRAVRADSSDARAWFARASLRLAIKDSAGGIADMRRAAQLGDTMAQGRLRPRSARPATPPMVLAAMNRRADSLEWLGDFTGAFAIYDSVVQMSHWAMAFANRARVLRRLGSNDAALRDLDSALASAPMLPPARLARGNLRLERGDKSGAQEDLEKAMTFDFNNPHCPECFFHRGMLKIGLGDKERGMKDIRVSADQGWANAQRVVSGLRPVPVESLNAVYALERDSVMKAAREAADRDSRDAGAAQSGGGGNFVTSFTNRARPLLPRTLPWLGGLAAFILVFVGVLALWLRLTPENRMAEFEFEPGERQVWAGAPVQGVIFRLRGSQAMRMAVTLVVVGTFLFVQTNGFAGGEGWVFAIPGVPLTLVAVYLLFGRHFVDARRRKMTVYAFTNKRAIVSVGREMQAYPIEALRSATLVEHGDGTGSITWGSVEGDLERELGRALAEGRSPSSIGLRGLMKSGRSAQRQFDRIPAARAVFDRIQSAAGAVPASAPKPEPERAVRVQIERSPAAAGAGAGALGAESRRSALLIFGVFTVLGLVLTYFLGYLPVKEFVAARDWLGVPCKIVSSRVESHLSTTRDSDGDTQTERVYNVDVAFRYEYKGQRYTGTRYQLRPVGRGGMGAERAINAKVAALSPGLASTCWLDPAAPENAVLDRSITMGQWFGLIPLLFFVIGVVGLVNVVRGKRRAGSEMRDAL